MNFFESKHRFRATLLQSIIFSTLCLGLSFSAKAQTAQSLEELVKSLSDGKLRVEIKAIPYKIIADFDADKVPDVAVIVELLELPKNITSRITKVYPYYTNTVSKNDLAMLIIHGKGKGWQFSQKESILLIGENSAMIFEKQRLGEEGDAVKIEKDKRGRVRLFFSTEGSEGYLRWNGKKYIWWETNP